VDSNPTAWYAVIHDRALQRMCTSCNSDAAVIVVVDMLICESTVELSLSQMLLLLLAAFVHTPCINVAHSQEANAGSERPVMLFDLSLKH
jgi:hypothetical protein